MNYPSADKPINKTTACIQCHRIQQHKGSFRGAALKHVTVNKGARYERVQIPSFYLDGILKTLTVNRARKKKNQYQVMFAMIWR